MYHLHDYSFDLPKNKITHQARQPAHDGLLMVIDKKTGEKKGDTTFWYLDTLLTDRHTLFFNNSKVVPARVYLENVAYKTQNGEEKILDSGEIFFLQSTDESHFDALVRPGKKLKVWASLSLGKFHLEIQKNTDTGRNIQLSGGSVEDFLSVYGSLPLPPYIDYSKEKEKDYQSIFAKENGSVAAPTASLHFTDALLQKLPCDTKNITLHVGLGTFQSVDTSDIRDYEIHSEVASIEKSLFSYIYRKKKAGDPILAVGTTVCRTLESLPPLWAHIGDDWKKDFSQEERDFWDTQAAKSDPKWIENIVIFDEKVEFSTRAYIVPGYQWLIADEVITNFHLPESSLLMLISSLIGRENLLDRYAEAIRWDYLFYSFGDGMYIR